MPRGGTARRAGRSSTTTAASPRGSVTFPPSRMSGWALTACCSRPTRFGPIGCSRHRSCPRRVAHEGPGDVQHPVSLSPRALARRDRGLRDAGLDGVADRVPVEYLGDTGSRARTAGFSARSWAGYRSCSSSSRTSWPSTTPRGASTLDMIARGPGDLLIAAMGIERCYLEFYDTDRESSRFLGQITELYIHWARVQLEALPTFQGGYLQPVRHAGAPARRSDCRRTTRSICPTRCSGSSCCRRCPRWWMPSTSTCCTRTPRATSPSGRSTCRISARSR